MNSESSIQPLEAQSSMEEDDTIKRLFEEHPYAELDSQENSKESKANIYCCGYRWLTIGLLALGMVIIHAQRVNIAVSFLAVYNETRDKVGNEQAKENLSTETTWSALKISLLHSSFFVGYLATQIPAGILSYKFQAQRLYGGAVLITCVFNMLLPALINKDIYWATCLVRLSQGLAEGFLWPCSYVLVNNWSTKEEMSKLAGFVATGSYAGAIIGFPVCGLITHYIGWQYIFYSSGVSGILWTLVWILVVYEKPDHHPHISEKELARLTHHKTPVVQFTIRKLPWKELFSSSPFLAVCACAFAKGWVFNLLLMQEPTYLHVFGFTIAENGFVSALPFLLKIIVSSFSGIMADLLANNTRITKTRVRKVFNTLGFGIEAICLFSLAFIYNGAVALTLLSIGVSMGGLSVSGWQINHLDLAPQLAGILVAISQCFSNVAGIFSPMVAGAFIEESVALSEAIATKGVHVLDVDIYGWHLVFLVASLIVMICCVFFVLFASGEVQIWAHISEKSSTTMLLKEAQPSISYKTLTQTQQQPQLKCDVKFQEELGPNQQTTEMEMSN